MTDDARVPVTVEDRDAAGHLMRSLGEPERHISRFFNGELDHTDVVQAFKAHRLAGVAAGREEAAKLADMVAGKAEKLCLNDDVTDGRVGALMAAETIAAAIRQRGE